MARRPPVKDPNLDRALREIWQAIDRMNTGTVNDLRGRRTVNTAAPVQRRDYTNKAYVDDLVQQFRDEVKRELRKVGRKKVVAGSSGGGGTPGSSPIDFGYYGALTIQNGAGDYTSTVKAWTNIVYLGPADGGVSEVPPSERKANLAALCLRAAAQGFNIMLDVGLGGALTVGDVLQCGQPVWDKVKYVILRDEPSPADFDVNLEIQLVKNRMTNLGLPIRPIGATFTPATVLTQNVGQYNFDFINIEAYTSPCACGGCGVSPIATEIATVKNTVQQMKALIPATKNLTVVMQGYNRNGAWSLSNEDLAELNRATWFEMVKGDSRCKAIMIFAYWRENPSSCGTNHGTFGMPEVSAAHQEIWADMTGGSSTGGEKKCATDPRPCPGQPVCCEGGASNPCNCPRLCEGGTYAAMVTLAVQSTITAHPELFSGGLLISEAAAIQFRGFITVSMNTVNPSLETIDDPSDGKQILTRARVAATFREDYAVWSSDLRPRFPPGAYRASCYPGTF